MKVSKYSVCGCVTNVDECRNVRRQTFQLTSCSSRRALDIVRWCNDSGWQLYTGEVMCFVGKCFVSDPLIVGGVLALSRHDFFQTVTFII